MQKLKIYLVDDHKLFREGLKLLLSTQDFVHHIYEASNGREFLENLSLIDCDVVLMDIEMPEINGIDATREALKLKPDLKIIVLSMYGDEQYYYQMIDAGAKGFMLKNTGIENVITAIRKVAAGENFFSEELLFNILNTMRDTKMSPKLVTTNSPKGKWKSSVTSAKANPTRKSPTNCLSVSALSINTALTSSVKPAAATLQP